VSSNSIYLFCGNNRHCLWIFQASQRTQWRRHNQQCQSSSSNATISLGMNASKSDLFSLSLLLSRFPTLCISLQCWIIVGSPAAFAHLSESSAWRLRAIACERSSTSGNLQIRQCIERNLRFPQCTALVVCFHVCLLNKPRDHFWICYSIYQRYSIGYVVFMEKIMLYTIITSNLAVMSSLIAIFQADSIILKISTASQFVYCFLHCITYCHDIWLLLALTRLWV